MVSSRVYFPVMSVDSPFAFALPMDDPPLRARGRPVQTAWIASPPQSLPRRHHAITTFEMLALPRSRRLPCAQRSQAVPKRLACTCPYADAMHDYHNSLHMSLNTVARTHSTRCARRMPGGDPPSSVPAPPHFRNEHSTFWKTCDALQGSPSHRVHLPATPVLLRQASVESTPH